MNQSANEVVKSAIFAAVCDAVMAFRMNAGGSPNVLIRDLSAVHENATIGDLPESVQKAITESTTAAFRRLLKEGYVVQPKTVAGSDRYPPRKIKS